MTISKIKEIYIHELFGYLNHTIPLNEEGITFIHGTNGCGKTTVLRLISAIFLRKTSVLFEIDFSRIDITSNDNTIFSLEKKYQVIDTADGEKYRIPTQLEFSIKNSTIKPFILLRDNVKSRLRLTSVAIEKYLPFLKRITTEEWIDRNTGNHLGYRDILEQYGDILPNSNHYHSSSSEENLNDWLDSHLLPINLHFIKTQRLLKIDSISAHRNRVTERSAAEVIQIYSDDIKSTISKNITKQAAVSQSYDRSFPKRLLSITKKKSVSEDLIRDLYAKTDEKIQGLVNAGLIDEQENISLPNDKLQNTEKKVLSLYLDDINNKLSIFDELQNKIQIFLEIINKKLRNKRLSINKTNGFVIKSLRRLGEELKPTQLSSGEQHQIVLFYELIFKADKNAFFLIDEPEISLHVDWQRSFLSDIHKISSLGDRNFLIATHSPQIIGNHRELAVALEEGILVDE